MLKRIFLYLLLSGWGAYVTQSQSILSAMLDKESFYYVDFNNYPVADKMLPIGVFDSGTGGLTVLDAIVNFDKFDNLSNKNGKDGVPDFERERFIYLADQANMPYGNYAAAGKTDLLQEHIFKDVQFLLSDKYYSSHTAGDFKNDKLPVKVIVIACNTATAFGQAAIESYFASVRFPVKVIGVIDAGSRAAIQTFARNEEGSIAIFATAGTVASGGYERALTNLMQEYGYSGSIQLFSQGGVGLAESIDEDINYINRNAGGPRKDYKGPDIAASQLLIDRQLFRMYNFDFSDQKMLCDAQNPEDCSQLQINDPVNYLRYHLVSLMEKIRSAPEAKPLKTIILGCTHYPYLTKEIHQVLDELRNFQEADQYRYRHLMADEIELIDPAVNTAEELYVYLHDNEVFNSSSSMTDDSEFYISIPNSANPNVITDEEGRFTYDYKYGRTAGQIQEYVRVVPFANDYILPDVKSRLKAQIPFTWNLIEAFHHNPKTGF